MISNNEEALYSLLIFKHRIVSAEGQRGECAADVHGHSEYGAIQGPRGGHLRHGHRLHDTEAGDKWALEFFTVRKKT